MTEAVDPLDESYLEALKLAFDTDPVTRAVMQIARRVGIPFSEVVERWSRQDLAMELAWADWELDAELRRCPGCGIDPTTQLKANHRDHGKDFAWRLEVHSCEFCEERDEVQARMAGEQYKKAPPRVYYTPRQGDEPFIDPENMLT